MRVATREHAAQLGPEFLARFDAEMAAAAMPESLQALRLAAETRRNRPRITGLNVLGQNKTEAAFDRHLEDLKRAGRIRDFRWEPFKLRIAGRCWLKIDFVVLPVCPVLNAQPLVLVDVKGGPWEDDFAVKAKLCAEMFAWLGTFWVVRKDRRDGWEYRSVKPRTGLGKPEYGDPCFH